MPAAPTGGVPALFAFTGLGRDLVVALKYRNGRSVLPWLGAALARLVPAQTVDLVTWAPTHARRRRRRGYDQSELVARAAARALGLPCRGVLRRTDRAGPQTGRPRWERLAAPSFAATGSLDARVLLVDDVVTTGATLAAAAAALTAAGARTVRMVAVAATPPGGGWSASRLAGPRERGDAWTSA